MFLIHIEETSAQVEQHDTMIYEVQHVPLKFDQIEIRKLQEKDPYYAKLIKDMKLKNKRRKGDYSLDSHRILYKKIKDHGKEFIVLIIPETIQIYMHYEILFYHIILGYNGTTRLHQFLKRQYYWKGLKTSVQKYVRHCQKCQNTNLHTPNYVQLYLKIPQTLMDFISIDLTGS